LAGREGPRPRAASRKGKSRKKPRGKDEPQPPRSGEHLPQSKSKEHEKLALNREASTRERENQKEARSGLAGIKRRKEEIAETERNTQLLKKDRFSRTNEYDAAGGGRQRKEKNSSTSNGSSRRTRIKKRHRIETSTRGGERQTPERGRLASAPSHKSM